jgi:general secretion pathway protein G
MKSTRMRMVRTTRMVRTMRMMRQTTGRSSERGLSYIELLVAAMVLLILASAAIPLTRWDHKRRAEARLKVTLRTMRAAIDQYKKYADEGLIMLTDVEQMGYPKDLEELVNGVQIGDPQSPEAKTIYFLKRIPEDPITGEVDWGLRSYQDEWDSDAWGGENVYDVYSLAPGIALDGSEYSEW